MNAHVTGRRRASSSSFKLPDVGCLPRLRIFVKMFEPGFVPMMLDGSKGSTIRPLPRRPQDWPSPSDILDARHWAGRPYRSGHVCIARFRIVEVRVVELDAGGVKLGLNGSQILSLERMVFAGSPEAEMFARRDGFGSWGALTDFFTKKHGLPFRGILIGWEAGL